MSGSLKDFLVNLASSTTLMSEFAADPARDPAAVALDGLLRLG